MSLRYRTILNTLGKQLLLLDEFPNAAAAYSLRLLRGGYTGNCIEVRRSSDNATQNIGFVNGVLDTASLLSFVGAGDGFVRTWYDQSGNGRDATNTTNGEQPFIVAGGVLYTQNSKPVVRNPTANTLRRLVIGLSTLQLLPVTTIFAGRVVGLPSNAFNNISFYLGGTNTTAGGGSRYEMSANNDAFRVQRRGTLTTRINTETPFNTNPFIQQGFFRTSQLEGRQGGVDATPLSYSGTEFNNASNFQLIQGQGNLTTYSANLSAFEYVIYLSDQHANRVGIENNINKFYNIY